jgi:hypothetical protein
MFRSYDHLQVDMFFLGCLVNLVDTGDRFLVTVDAGAVVELTVACSGCTWRSSILALPMLLAFVVLWIPLVSRLAFSCRIAKCATPWYVIFPCVLAGVGAVL